MEKDFILSELHKTLEDLEKNELLDEENSFPFLIFDQLNDLIFLINDFRTITYVNSKINSLGYSASDFKGKDVAFIFEGEISKQMQFFFSRKASNKIWVFKDYLTKIDGTKVFFEFKLKCFNIDNEYFYVLIGRDLTENEKLKKDIEKLKKDEEEIKKVLELSNIGIWKWDVLNDKITYDNRYQKILGYDKDLFQESWETFEEFIHEEDRKHIVNLIKEHFLERTTIYESTYRIKSKDGNYIWFLSRAGVVEKNKFGLPRFMIGTYTEISEYKEKIDEIKKEKAFIQKVLENMGQGLLILDYDFNIMFANKAFYKMLNLEKPHANNYEDFLVPKYIEVFEKEIEKLKSEKEEIVSFECELKYRPDKIITVIVTAVAYEEEQIKRIILVMTDITEKKKLEELLKRYATFDDLTTTYNRRAGFYALEKYFQLSKRRREPLTIVFIDIDNLKYINDNFGHDAGDFVIKKVADVIKNSLRESDLIIRIGGDEFLLGLPNTKETDVEIIFQRMSKELEKVKFDGEVRISLSWGICEYNNFDEEITLESVIKKADNKMYEMKSAKKE